MPTLKFKYNESIKRVSIDTSEVSFSVLVLKVKESFAALSTVDNRTLSFLWQDGDGDKCTCETDREIQDAILELERLSKPLLFEVSYVFVPSEFCIDSFFFNCH